MKKFIIGFFIFFILYLIFSNLFTQKSKYDSNTSNNFVETGYYKSQNKQRVFSIYTPHMDFIKMENYAKKKMYSLGAMTVVFFFNDRNNTPNVTFVGLNFPKEYEKYCVAGYWKYATGKEKFIKYPFKK